LNEEDEDDGYWDEGEAPWRESASKYDESNPFSLKNILWLSENNKYPSRINDSEHRVMEKLISLLSNWDIEPEYSEVTQEMLQKACGDFPSKRDMKHTLNSLSKKGLIDVQNVPTGEYKRDKGGFMVIGKDKRPIALTEPLIYPKPLMCLYAWNAGLATPKWLQNEIAENIAQEKSLKKTFNGESGERETFDGGWRCGTCDKMFHHHNDAKHGGCSKDQRYFNEGVGEYCGCNKYAEDRAEYCCMGAESFAGEMDATQCDYCGKNKAKSEFPPVKGYWGRIHPDDPDENDKMGYCSQECFVGSLGKCDDCSSPFKIGDNYNRYEDEYEITLTCDDCFKGYPICETCDVKYHPDGEHMQSCDTCDGDGYVMVGYDPGDGYMEPPSSDSDPCGECYDGKVCSLEAESYSAESNELEESKKRTKMSMIRTGLAITTFGIVLFNLWTNKKQEKDISDIMDLV